MSFRRDIAGLNISLSSKFRAVAKYVAPPLYRKLCENKAKALFESRSTEKTFRSRLQDNLISRYLTEAGHDPSSDVTYQNIFALKGGKAEYDALMHSPVEPDLNSAEQPVARIP